MITKEKITDCYQSLFEFMHSEYNLILTISEMDEIIITSKKVIEKINNLQD